MLKLSKVLCSVLIVLCLMFSLAACTQRNLAGHPAYDRLDTEEAQELYEELLNDIEAERYEVTIDVSEPQQLLDACDAIISDLADSLTMPTEIKTLEQKDLLNGKQRFKLRIIYSEQ